MSTSLVLNQNTTPECRLLVLRPPGRRGTRPHEQPQSRCTADEYEEEEERHTSFGVRAREDVFAPDTPSGDAGDDGGEGEEWALCCRLVENPGRNGSNVAFLELEILA